MSDQDSEAKLIETEYNEKSIVRAELCFDDLHRAFCWGRFSYYENGKKYVEYFDGETAAGVVRLIHKAIEFGKIRQLLNNQK